MSLRRGHAGRVDQNHTRVVQAFRAYGWSVFSMAELGHGRPDLAASKHGRTLLIEVKSPKGQLTPDEVKWLAGWQGEVFVVRSLDDVARLNAEHAQRVREGLSWLRGAPNAGAVDAGDVHSVKPRRKAVEQSRLSDA